jgi:hypothetical protein
MRRLVLACAFLLLVLPAAALATALAPGDGTLAVKNANGRIDIAARGAVIASCDRCSITIEDPTRGDGTGPIVTGDESQVELTDTKSRWTGVNMRFRIIGGFSRTIVAGRGIDLSAVGQGSATVRALPDNEGTYSVNGGERRLIPIEPFSFLLRDASG